MHTFLMCALNHKKILKILCEINLIKYQRPIPAAIIDPYKIFFLGLALPNLSPVYFKEMKKTLLILVLENNPTYLYNGILKQPTLHQ